MARGRRGTSRPVATALEDPKEIVVAGYDTLAARYREWAGEITDDPRDVWLERLTAGLRPGSRILDLGCGAGVPTARSLAVRFAVTGVDISPRQIELARAAVPSVRFLCADMAVVDFDPGSFDAVVALFSLIHLPPTELGEVLERVADWLAPGGRLLATFGTVDDDGVQDDWLGVPMFFGLTSPVQTRGLLAMAGFEILAEEVITVVEPGEGEVSFHWVDARTR